MDQYVSGAIQLQYLKTFNVKISDFRKFYYLAYALSSRNLQLQNKIF